MEISEFKMRRHANLYRIKICRNCNINERLDRMLSNDLLSLVTSDELNRQRAASRDKTEQISATYPDTQPKARLHPNMHFSPVLST